MNENEAKKWIVFLDLGAYSQHGDMIGNVVKKNRFGRALEKNGKLIPETDAFSGIANGDIVVYYARVDGLVVGLFEVDDPQKGGIERKNDQFWSTSIVHYIKPYLLPTHGKFLDFKKLLRENEKKFPFETFRDVLELELKSKSEDVQNHICQRLSENDYSRIKAALSNPSYLVDSDSFSKCPLGVLSSILDFYNSRSTSFASLFVASIFGIVTLSAIITTSIKNSLQAAISIFPYLIFVGAGAYILIRYAFYAGIAEKIKSNGIEYPYANEINKPMLSATLEGRYQELGLADFIIKSEQEQTKSFPKKYLEWHYIYYILYAATIITLTVVAYWSYPLEAEIAIAVTVIGGFITIFGIKKF